MVMLRNLGKFLKNLQVPFILSLNLEVGRLATMRYVRVNLKSVQKGVVIMFLSFQKETQREEMNSQIASGLK